MTRNGIHFHQTDSTVVILDIPSIIIVKIIIINKNQCQGEQSVVIS